MPIHLDNVNLIVRKTILESKYKGGIEQFRQDFHLLDKQKKLSHEDNELISITDINWNELNQVLEAGLEFDEKKQCSDDFVIRTKSFGYLWNVDWLVDNSVFAWDINASKESITRAVKIGIKTSDEMN